jgi:hypothetical protein
LGVARSTAWLWVRHLPLDPSTERARAKPEHSKLMTDARWMKHRADRDAEHERVTTEAAAFVGELSEREILLLGTAIYWCEGSKSKPWRRSERIIFTNRDPHLIRLFLTFLRTVVDAAGAWWAEQLGVPIEAFRPPTIKRHKPSTNRKNNGEDYHGCLVIDVARGRHLYWHVEGLIAAMAGRM